MTEDIERGPAFSPQPVGLNLLSQPTDEQRQAVAAVLRGLADQIEDKDSVMPLRLGWVDTEVNRPGPRTLQAFDPFGDDIIADNDPTAVLRRCAADRKIVGHYQATVDALAAAQGTILAGACKVRLGAYENVLHALAEGYGLTEQQKDQP